MFTDMVDTTYSLIFICTIASLILFIKTIFSKQGGTAKLFAATAGMCAVSNSIALWLMDVFDYNTGIELIILLGAVVLSWIFAIIAFIVASNKKRKFGNGKKIGNGKRVAYLCLPLVPVILILLVSITEIISVKNCKIYYMQKSDNGIISSNIYSYILSKDNRVKEINLGPSFVEKITHSEAEYFSWTDSVCERPELGQSTILCDGKPLDADLKRVETIEEILKQEQSPEKIYWMGDSGIYIVGEKIYEGSQLIGKDHSVKNTPNEIIINRH